MVSVAGNLSVGEIFGGSGVDTVIITGSLVGGATARLDSSGSMEESADSISIGNIISGVLYGESGSDTFNISGDARKASIFGGAQNDLVTIGLSSVVEGAEGVDTINVANMISATVKGGADAMFSASAVVSAGVCGNSGNDTALDGLATSASA